MNKKSGVIVAGIMAAIATLAGCDDETYTYQVSGTVEARRVDYECSGHLSMEAVAFPTGSGRGSVGGSIGSGGRSRIPSPNSTPGKAGKTSRGWSGKTSSSTSRTSGSTPGDGVKLSKKPGRPKKVPVIPRLHYIPIPKGCQPEYELFVRSGGGIYEQDVRQTDYDRCMEESRFPACTEA